MKWKIKIILFTFFLSGFLFLVQKAEAGIIRQQLFKDSFIFSALGHPFVQSFATSTFDNFVGKIPQKVSFSIRQSQAGTWFVFFCIPKFIPTDPQIGTIQQIFGDPFCDSGINKGSFSIPSQFNDIPQNFTINFNTTSTIQAGKSYILYFNYDIQAQATGFQMFGSQNSNADPSGSFFNRISSNPPAQLTDSGHDMFFILETEADNQVNFNFPQDQIGTNDFDFWDLNIHFNKTTPTSTFGGVFVFYATSTTNLSLSSNKFFTDLKLLPNGGVFDTTILKSRNLEIGDWFAKAELQSGNGSILATSSVIHFVINNATVSVEHPFFPPTGKSVLTSSTINQIFASSTIDCSAFEFSLFSSTTVQALGCQAKKTAIEVLNFLLFPQFGGLDFFNNQIAAFKNVFPFNIFFNFKEIAQSNIITHQITDKKISLPLLFNSSTIPIITSSTLANFIGQSNKDLIFDFQKQVIWIFTGFLIIASIL